MDGFSRILEKKLCHLLCTRLYQLTNFLLHTVAIAPSNRTIWIKIVVRYRICSYPSILIIYNHFHTVTPIIIHISFCPINGTAIRFKVWIVPYDSKKSTWLWLRNYQVKVEKILKGSLDSIPSPSVKIQIFGGKVCLRYKSKTLLGIVNKLLKTKGLLTSSNNVLPYYIWIKPGYSIRNWNQVIVAGTDPRSDFDKSIGAGSFFLKKETFFQIF